MTTFAPPQLVAVNPPHANVMFPSCSPAREERVAAIFDEHYDAIWRTLRRLGVADANVDDAAQRVFVIAARRIDTILVGHEGRYLYGVAVRVASELRRRDPRRREVSADVLDAIADEAPGPEQTLIDREARKLLDVALTEMPDDLREVLVLIEIEGLPAPEIAAMLEIPIGTVASRLRRAREAFTDIARRMRSRATFVVATAATAATAVGGGGAR